MCVQSANSNSSAAAAAASSSSVESKAADQTCDPSTSCVQPVLLLHGGRFYLGCEKHMQTWPMGVGTRAQKCALRKAQSVKNRIDKVGEKGGDQGQFGMDLLRIEHAIRQIGSAVTGDLPAMAFVWRRGCKANAKVYGVDPIPSYLWIYEAEFQDDKAAAAAGACKIDDLQQRLEEIKREAADRDAEIATLQADLRLTQQKREVEAVERKTALAVWQRDLRCSESARKQLCEQKDQLQKERDELFEALADKHEQLANAVHAHRLDLERMNDTVVELRNKKEKLQKEVQCTVCMDADRSVFYLPCCHFLVCAGCDARIAELKQPCPNCRGKIQGRCAALK